MTGGKLRAETRNTVILGVIFVVALLLVYLNEMNSSKREAVNQVTKPYLFGFDPGEVVQLDITDNNGNTLLQLKKGEGQWMAFAPNPREMNDNVPMEMLSKIAMVRSNRVISGQAENLAVYGLQAPSVSFRLLLLDGSQPTLRIGGESPNKLFRYAMTEANSDIYMIPANTVALIEKLTRQLIEAIPQS
jgi:hypothetical protein